MKISSEKQFVERRSYFYTSNKFF